MTNKPSTKRRNKIATVLLAPVLIVLFFIGWLLYFVGQSSFKQTDHKYMKTCPSKKEKVELMVIPPKAQEVPETRSQ